MYTKFNFLRRTISKIVSNSKKEKKKKKWGPTVRIWAKFLEGSLIPPLLSEVSTRELWAFYKRFAHTRSRSCAARLPEPVYGVALPWKATPPPPTPMTLIKLRIKGAMTCSVPATWRVAYSLPTPLVVLLTDTLFLSLSLSSLISFLERLPSRFKPPYDLLVPPPSSRIFLPLPNPFHLSTIDQATSTVLVSSIDRSRCKWPARFESYLMHIRQSIRFVEIMISRPCVTL